MRQTTIRNTSNVERKWYIIDLDGQVLGRAATQIADLLRGKGKVDFTPNIDCGDHVICINASKVKLTGNKLDGKKYYRHSGFRGGLRVRTARTMQEDFAEQMVELAVKGMMQKNKLANKQIKKLHVFEGAEHNMEAQQPIEYKL